MKNKINNKLELENILRSDLSRRIALATVLGLILMFAGWLIFVNPARRAIQQKKQTMIEYQNTLNNNRGLLAQAQEIEEKHRQTGLILQAIIADKMVPRQASLGWVSLLLQELADQENLNVMERTGNFTSVTTRASDAEPPIFQNFIVQFNLAGGYHQIGRFLARLERRIPYATLQSITVSRARTTAQEDGLVLNASISYKFPRFNDNAFPPEKRPESKLDFDY